MSLLMKMMLKRSPLGPFLILLYHSISEGVNVLHDLPIPNQLSVIMIIIIIMVNIPAWRTPMS